MSRKRKFDLPKFVQPYGQGKYKVAIIRKNIRHVKSGFSTVEAARDHALNVLSKIADKVMLGSSPDADDTAINRIIEDTQKQPSPGHACEECGYSQPGQFFKCPKCGGYRIGIDGANMDTDAILRDNFSEEAKRNGIAAPAPSCGNCIHEVICRLKDAHEAGMLETMRHFYPKMDAGLIRQIIAFYCEHYRRKG